MPCQDGMATGNRRYAVFLYKILLVIGNFCESTRSWQVYRVARADQESGGLYKLRLVTQGRAAWRIIGHGRGRGPRIMRRGRGRGPRIMRRGRGRGPIIMRRGRGRGPRIMRRGR